MLLANNNQLSGSIPESLGQCSSLKKICLHSNQLTGTIPTQLCVLAELQVIQSPSSVCLGCVHVSLTHS